eukprot:365080-Chlamydomonas_euryale.AAC.9
MEECSAAAMGVTSAFLRSSHMCFCTEIAWRTHIIGSGRDYDRARRALAGSRGRGRAMAVPPMQMILPRMLQAAPRHLKM